MVWEGGEKDQCFVVVVASTSSRTLNDRSLRHHH